MNQVPSAAPTEPELELETETETETERERHMLQHADRMRRVSIRRLPEPRAQVLAESAALAAKEGEEEKEEEEANGTLAS